MGHLNKCIRASVLLVLCQSQYFSVICTLQVIKTKTIEENITLVCKDEFSKWINGLNANSEYLTSRKDSKSAENPDLKKKSSHKNRRTRNKSKVEEERLICQDIMSMDMNSIYNKTKDNNFTIVIPLNLLNITSLTILFILILFGSYYVWKIITRKKCLCKICKNEYVIDEKLGIGGFGEIYKVRKGNENLILKRCKTDDITEADDILLEAKHLRNLEHKNIVKYIDDFIHVENNKGKLEPTYYVIIIMEYCEGGDLKNQIDNLFYLNSHFSKQEILEILIQICEGLYYLHNKNIIHRDIKSQNIFLTKHNTIRIGDFGLAKKLKKHNNKISFMTKVGTDCYMAPEVLQGEIYSKPADVWSLGCVLHEMCTLNFMWMQDTNFGMASITKQDFHDTCLGQITQTEYTFFKDILKHILIPNPDNRMKIDTLLKKLKKEKCLMNNKKKLNK